MTKNNVQPVNGLELLEISSKPVPIESITNIEELTLNELLKIISKSIKTNSSIVVYLDYKVLIGNYSNESFSFSDNQEIEPKYIQRIRIFNKDEELFLWRSEGKLKGRHIKDNENGKGKWVVDNHQVLFGTEALKLNDKYTLLKEKRGTEIILPFGTLLIDENENRVKIKTRHYVSFNEIQQAVYVDSRFVEFTFGVDNITLGGN